VAAIGGSGVCVDKDNVTYDMNVKAQWSNDLNMECNGLKKLRFIWNGEIRIETI
jgi:hypothetical protein